MSHTRGSFASIFRNVIAQRRSSSIFNRSVRYIGGTAARSTRIQTVVVLGAFATGSAVTLALNYCLDTPPIYLDTQPIAETPQSYASVPFKKSFPEAVEALQKVLGDKITIDEHELLAHGDTPNTYHKGASPSVVLFAESTEDVSTAMKIAYRYRMPVIPFSGGTSLEGHLTAPHGGLSIDLSRMDKILHVNVEDGDLICQSGARWQDINEHLEDQGIPLFFPLDPGPGATIGGMIGTGCSGTNAMRYGTARSEWFINATVVLPDGSVIKTRSRARKSSAGFDLTKLFIGAEGTLGIVTEATLRLAPLLPYRVAICSFPSIKDAVNCVVDVVNAGLPVQCAELCDAFTMEAINHSGLCSKEFQTRDSIFFKFQGDDGTMDRVSELAAKLVAKNSGDALQFAVDKQESDEIWHGRKVIHWSLMAMKPGCKMYSTDVCVPLSRLPQLVLDTQKDLREHGLTAGLLGHAGDGNFHAGLMFMDDSEYQAVDAAAHRMVNRAIALEGTCTGEHGVGVGKKRYLRKELGDGTVDLMRVIKDAIDPKQIMNPGKLYPD